RGTKSSSCAWNTYQTRAFRRSRERSSRLVDPRAVKRESRSMATGQIWAVVMAGGSGTRFWPASRSARPKQLLPLGGGDQSLLAATVARIAPMVPAERTLVVTAKVLAEATRRELPELPQQNLLAEPAPRNTAPCIGWATRNILARDPDAL